MSTSVDAERFDEAAYLAMYPDVARAVDDGSCVSGWQHFLACGRSEGRRGILPEDFDEAVYLELHPSIAWRVRDGELPSGGFHYLLRGVDAAWAYTRPSRTKARLTDLIWRGRDPFDSIPEGLYAADVQGWNSHHPYLERAVREVKPLVVVEVGVWKGGSAITLGQALKRHQPEGAVVAIDTWLGSSEHWLDPEKFESLAIGDGFPQLYRKFLSNVKNAKLQTLMVPLPIDSINGQQLLSALKIEVNVVHIDAGHDYHSVSKDLAIWWDMLTPGGALIADDYFPGGEGWPGVLRAVDEFVENRKPQVFENSSGKAYLVKAGA